MMKESNLLSQKRFGIRGRLHVSCIRRFAFVLSLVAAASCMLFAACSPVDAAGTIPRSNVHAPRAAHRLTVINAMLFEVGENPLEKKSVSIPAGDYVFEGEDDVFLYFRSPEEMEYRVYHKEGYAEGVFQLGGLALARKEEWDKVEYPACTYIDGKDQNQKRLTCPLEISFLIQKRGTDWDSDFDKAE
ncbi:MAG: hypothetical protein IJT68_02480 [Lentisphaeria bacterium]|nr:hypothetical protein [Lentisphaeria bacterium]MBR3506992.1 hypothetical protein [Lentisphaeria bacterium]